MEITQPLTMDLAQPMPMVPVSAVQGDGNTRVLSVTLLENGTPWQIPPTAVVDVAFRKSDGTKGIYSRLPDGSAATHCTGNVLSATLAPQMLTCPGPVLATFVFRTDGGKTLAAFPFTVTVAASPAAGAALSEDYFNPTELSDLRAEIAAKAPAGFGLGETATTYYPNTEAELEAMLNTILAGMEERSIGFYSFEDNTGTIWGGGAYIALVSKVFSGFASVQFYGYSNDGAVTQKTQYAGAWRLLEWVNPPMAFNAEYRTTKRHNGKTVYARLIDLSALPSNSTRTYQIAVSGSLTDIVSKEILCSNNGTMTNLETEPWAKISYNIPNNYLIVTTTTALSDYYGTARLEYTKEQ